MNQTSPLQIPMSIESGLAAYFERPEGPSMPGVSWLIRIEHGGSTYRARVKALPVPDARPWWRFR